MNEDIRTHEKKREKQPQRWLRAALSGLVIVALSVSMLGYLTKLMEKKTSYEKNSGLFEQNAYDVLFFGNSHMHYGVYPMELWHDYGIVSYNLASDSARFPIGYYLLLEALRICKPKVVVFDCYYLSKQEKGNNTVGGTHEAFDFMPLDQVKLQAIGDVLEKYDNKLEFVWDFILYHDRWDELTEKDFAPVLSVEKGAGTLASVAIPLDDSQIDRSSTFDDDTVGVQYIEKVIELCLANDISIILTYLPYPMYDNINAAEANRAAQISEKYGIDYLNFMQMDVVDFDTDCYDKDSHMNVSGARKISAYLGRYIQDRYGISDKREDAAYADWNAQYQEYHDQMITLLNGKTALKDYVMLLTDETLSTCIVLEDDPVWEEDHQYNRLLDNIGVKSEELNADGPTLAVIDHISGQVSYLSLNESVDTGFGQVSFTQTDEGQAILLNGEQTMTLSQDADVGAIVIDNAAGAVVSSRQFAVAGVNVNKIS